jgi:pilus assembly protein Flp/PilA
MTKLLKKIRDNKSGATAIEYGLIAALIAVVIISAATSLGTNVATKFNAVANAMN